MAIKPTKKGGTHAVGPPTPRLGEEALHQKVAERAYHRFLDKGQIHGYDLEDWFVAEREVLSEFKAQTEAKPSTTPEKRPVRSQEGRKRSASPESGTL